MRIADLIEFGPFWAYVRHIPTKLTIYHSYKTTYICMYDTLSTISVYYNIQMEQSGVFFRCEFRFCFVTKLQLNY